MLVVWESTAFGLIKSAARQITPLHPCIGFSGLCWLVRLDLVFGIQGLNQPQSWRKNTHVHLEREVNGLSYFFLITLIALNFLENLLGYM